MLGMDAGDLVTRFSHAAGFVGIGARFRSDFWISWSSVSWPSVRSHGWIHAVSDVWMNRWFLKRFSKDAFNRLADYVKDLKQKLQHMYAFLI